jgi:hypothetical protein
LLIALAALSHVITTSDEAPDRAKFVYDSTLKIYMPSPEKGQPAFYPVAGKFADVRDSVSSEWDGLTTWKEIKNKNGFFKDYTLPRGEGWDDFVFYSRPVPLWRSLIWTPESRWDGDGHWRY